MAHILTLILSILLFPITLVASWVVVHPQEEKLILIWGKLSKILKQTGSYVYPKLGAKSHPGQCQATDHRCPENDRC